MERKKYKGFFRIRQVFSIKFSHYTSTSFSLEMIRLETPQHVTFEQVPVPPQFVNILTSLHQIYTKLTVDAVGIIALGL